VPKKWSIAALILLSLLVYANALGNGFAYDDFSWVVDNPDFNLPLAQMFWTPYGADGFWRPLTLLTQAANFAITNKPFWHHLIDILAHAGVVVLLYQLLLDIVGRPRAAFVAALLFAVHPLHTEAVAPAYSRQEVVTAGLILGAWLLHWRGKTLWACLCFLLALGSKESAVCFLLLALAADWIVRRRVRKPAIACYAAILAVYLAMRWKAVGLLGVIQIHPVHNPLGTLSAPLRIANALRLAWLMLGLHVYPVRLTVEYTYNAVPVILDWTVLAGWIAASVAMLAAWWYVARRSQAVLLAGVIYMIGFATTSNIFFTGSVNFGERWAYLPSAGFCLLAGLAYEWMEQRRRLVAVGALTAIVAAGSIRTFLRNRDWKDNFTLFTAAVAAYPQSVKAQTFLGWEYLRRNDVARAEEHLLAAERIYPDYPLLQQDLGSLEFRKGDLPAAERHFEIALRASAGYSVEPEMLISYAALELQAGRYDKALALLNSAIRSWPGISRAYSNRAVVFYRMNRNDLARADVEMALRLNPGNLQASTLLGRL